MPSGKRQSALIFCVSPIKELYLEPIKHYDPNMMFVFKGIKDDELTKIEGEIYETSNVKCDYIRDITINTHNYISVLTNLVDIVKALKSEYDDYIDIFINISSGTHEFAAAAVFVSMTQGNITAFNIDVSDYGLNGTEIKEIIKRINPELEKPELIEVNDNNDPEDEIVGFLHVIDVLLKKSKYPSHKAIIKGLKDCGCWVYDENKKTSSKRTPLEHREELYLRRHYFDYAIEMGLIEGTKKIKITDKGRMQLRVFGEIDDCLSSVCLFDDADITENEQHTKYHRIYNRSIQYNSINTMDELNFEREQNNKIVFKRNGKTYRFKVEME